MGKEKTLRITIAGDADHLHRALIKGEKDLDKFGKHTETVGKRFSSSMKLAGAAAAGALAVGLKQSVNAAVEAEKSQARLQAQLKASGVSYRAHAAEIDKAIQATSKLSGLDDEDLTDSFTNIVRVTGDVNKSLKLVGLAADFARAKHIDVAKAGEIVAKVAGGNTGVLSRYGIQIRKGATATEALGALQKKFGGQAEAYGKTTAGATDRAKVGFENLQEVVGKRLAPVLAKVANKLADLANWAAANPGKFKAIAVTIGGVATAIGGLLIAAKVATAVATLRKAFIAINLAMAANPAVLIAAGIAAVGVALVVAYKKSEKFRTIVVGALGGVTKAIDLQVGAFSSMLTLLSHVPGFGWAKTAAKAIDGARAATRGFVENLNKIPKHVDVKINIRATRNKDAGKIKADDLVIPGFGPRAAGGLIPGTGDRDTVPSMLTPGEFVVRKQIVEKFGTTFFAAINAGQEPQRRTSGGIIAKANAIDDRHYPYVWGGGHSRSGVPDGGTGRDPGIGYDCSGAVSAILGVSPRVSGAFTSWGLPGPGSPNDTKVYANAEHIFAVLNGRGWGTSRENPGGGAGWISYNSRPGFTVRHVNDSGQTGKGAASAVGNPREAVETGGTVRTGPTRAEKAQRAGSRIANRLAAPALKVIRGATGRAASIGAAIDAADTSYGQTERRFGQVLGGVPGKFGEEDLGTAGGRSARTTELTALKALKRAQQARMQKRKAALERAAKRYEKLIKDLRKQRDKARGGKRTKLNERINSYDAKRIELAAEAIALGSAITDIDIDVGGLDKDIAEVAGTPDTAAEAAEAGPSTTDKVSGALSHIDALERAGDLDPAGAQAARKATLEQALSGGFGTLTPDETLNLRGDLREVTSALTAATIDNTSALQDVSKELARQNAIAESTIGVELATIYRALGDTMSGQLGYKTAGRSLLAGNGSAARYAPSVA